MRKHQINPTEEHSINTGAVLFKKFEGHKKQRKTKEQSQIGDVKTAIWHHELDRGKKTFVRKLLTFQ